MGDKFLEIGVAEPPGPSAGHVGPAAHVLRSVAPRGLVAVVVNGLSSVRFRRTVVEGDAGMVLFPPSGMSQFASV